MDSTSILLLLSNLLNLHNHLDPSSITTSTAPLSSSAAAPLLFFALASVLSYATTTTTTSLRSSPSPPPRGRSLFHSADRALSLSDPSARDATWRSLHGLSYDSFRSLLDHLSTVHFPPPSLRLPADRALSLALARLRHRRLPKPLPIAPSVALKALNSFTRLLSTRLYTNYLKPPKSARLNHILHSFRDLSDLPNLAGGIISCPIRVSLNNKNDSLSSPARNYPAILLQSVADSRKIFWDACVRAPGSTHPADHFRDSRLYARLLQGDLFRNNTNVRPYIVGDRSYPLLPYLLTPFDSRDDGTLNPIEENFNSAMAKARNGSAQAAVALLKGRWKILRNLNVGLDHAAQTVIACCVLHNVCQIGGEPEDEIWSDPPERPPPPPRMLESERSMRQSGETLRWAIAEDLYERQQQQRSGGR